MFVALDTETTLISETDPIPELVSVSTSYGSERNVTDLLHHEDPQTVCVVQELLDHHEIGLFNAPFDMAVLLRKYPSLVWSIFKAYEQGRIVDARTRERLLDVAWGLGLKRPYNLGAVAQRRLGIMVDKNDPWRLRYSELKHTPISKWPKEAVDYARFDALSTLGVCLDQEAHRYEDNIDLLVDQNRHVKAHWALHLMSAAWGIRTDQAAVEALDLSLKDEMDAAQRKLQEKGLVRADGTRDTKVTQAYAEQVGVDIRTPTGNVSLSEDTLKRVNDPLLNEYQKYGSIMGLRSRVIKALRAPIIRTRYEEFVESGRTSSSNPNVQNFPREGGFRECLVPADGNVFVVSDWAGAELVTHAQNLLELFGASELANALRDGCDAHLELAALLMGITYKEAVQRYEAGDPEVKYMRQCGKSGNFGFPGGLGVPRFLDYARTTYNLHLTLEQGYSIKQAWLDRWPENNHYLDWMGNQVQHNGLITILQPYSNRVRGGCRYTEACNSPFQGRAADIAKDVLFTIAKAQWVEEDSPLFGSYQFIFVHDEFGTECVANQAPAVAAEQERIMIAGYAVGCPDVPIKVETKIQYRYGK